MVKTYIPKTLKEAIEIKLETGAMPFAGGTDLMVKYKSWSGALPALPNTVVYIGDLEELKSIEIVNDYIYIGSAAKLSAILDLNGIPEYIRQPVKRIGSPPIRNLGTLGGNICNASPAGDSLPMLYALDAELELTSEEGSRLIQVSDFISGPGKTCLKPNEILTRIIIPKNHFNRWGFRKIGSRKANAISKLSVFFTASVDDSSLKDIRITFGALGPTIIRNRELENNLTEKGHNISTTDFEDAIEGYRNAISPISDVRSTKDYRSDVAVGILKEMIEKELMI